MLNVEGMLNEVHGQKKQDVLKIFQKRHRQDDTYALQNLSICSLCILVIHLPFHHMPYPNRSILDGNAHVGQEDAA